MKKAFVYTYLILCVVYTSHAQITKGKFGAGGTVDRSILPEHVANSEGLIHGGEFQDLILPLPTRQNRVKPQWGTEASRVRDAWYGIEDNEYSYWGGNVLRGDDNRYHCFVARWPENTPKGHFDWHQSTVAHAVSPAPLGPWQVLGEAYPHIRNGRGHNPEVRRLKDGRWALWLLGGTVLITETEDINSKWVEAATMKKSEDWVPLQKFNNNPSFADPRQDGSLVYCSRLGSIGIIPDGNPNSPIEGIHNGIYPTYAGGPEDPVIWKTGHQYHVIFNYWKVRLAVKLRSHDGVNWELDPGVAYTQLAEKYTDGTVVPWYKAERPKILQDKYSRATHLCLAFIDVIKYEDLSDDNHSSKHITFKLAVEGLTEILSKQPITSATQKVQVKLIAEKGFDPQQDVDVKSLIFGDPKAVNYGRGMQVVETNPTGKDLVVTFKGSNSGITADSFTGKIIGKKTDGSVYYAYPRLPGFADNPAVLVISPLRPQEQDGKPAVTFTVKNFGLAKSKPATLTIPLPGQNLTVKVPPLESYAQKSYTLPIEKTIPAQELQTIRGEFSPKYQTQL